MKCIILITVDSSVVSGLSTWLCNCPPRLSLELVSLHLTLKYTYLVIYSAISTYYMVGCILSTVDLSKGIKRDPPLLNKANNNKSSKYYNKS